MNFRKIILLAYVVLGATLMSQHAFAAKDLSRSIIKESAQTKGFFNLFYHGASGELYLELNKLDQEFLMLTSLPQGLGSNDIGLDRGQLGYSRLVKFERHGPFAVLKQVNTQFIAQTQNVAERRAAQSAFAESILWKGKVLDGKRPLVQINDLVLQDFHGIADTLAAREQGHFKLDLAKSYIVPASIKSFPNNSDLDIRTTYSTLKPGKFVQQVVPEPKHISLLVRYSFIGLPEPGYVAKAFEPTSGYLSESYLDFASPIEQDITKRRLLRHRLVKTTPGAEPSTVVEPIVYYLDSGVPEPIRTALLQGASWWSDAFTDAGFIDAFRVELLPEDADPQDIRFNMIQWVHRATRGWSYGSVISDPRTGEILKGHVTLGSQRVRQDHLIARGLTASWSDRAAAKEASLALALARIRQLAAHELGHTLGLDHNFAASSNNNASVMDYPHPYVRLEQDQIAIDAPYREGLGEWDKQAILHGYGDKVVPKEPSKVALATELRFIGEADSRDIGASHVYASLWDRGEDAVAELERLNQVRRFAIDHFSVKALLEEEPQGELSDTFVPIYLLSRYQVQAAAKWIGGTEYSYLDGEGSNAWHYVAPTEQKKAFEHLLVTLSPEYLAIPETLLMQLVPKAAGYEPTRESFASGLGVISDPLALAETSSRITLKSVLHPARLNRIFHAHGLDKEQLSIAELVNGLVGRTLYAEPPKHRLIGIWMRVNTLVLDELTLALHDERLSSEVKGQLLARLNAVSAQLKRKVKRENAYLSAHFAWLKSELALAIKDSKHRLIEKPLPIPPGSPI